MRTRLVPALLATSLAACADRVASPTPDAAQERPAAPAGAVLAQPGDTGSTITYASRVHVSGRVLAGSAPVAGMRVTLYRNVLQDGKGVSIRVGEQTTGADGAFSFVDVVGGPYVLALNVTPARPYGDLVAYALGTTAEVRVDIKIGIGSAATDSTRGG